MRIRPATPADAATLSTFAAGVFHDTFAPDNRPEDMALYAAAAFGEAQQRREIEAPGAVVLLAEDEGAADDGVQLAGYAHLVQGHDARGTADRAAIEIKRFYVAAPWQGSGLAATLMHAVLAEAIAREAKLVWLGVWERNARAIAFYRRLGYEVVGSQSFLLGTDEQTDLVMQRAV